MQAEAGAYYTYPFLHKSIFFHTKIKVTETKYTLYNPVQHKKSHTFYVPSGIHTSVLYLLITLYLKILFNHLIELHFFKSLSNSFHSLTPYTETLKYTKYSFPSVHIDILLFETASGYSLATNY